MRRIFWTVIFIVLFVVVAIAQGPVSPCDVNNSGSVDISDFQAVANMILGNTSCSANINGYHACNVTTAQRVANTILGQSCVFDSGSHYVSLAWTASTTPSVYYKVYRSTTSGSGYTLIGSSTTLAYNDDTVQLSTKYYYVVTAELDDNSAESFYSTEASATIPAT